MINDLVYPDYRYTSPSDQLSGHAELAGFVSALREALSISIDGVFVSRFKDGSIQDEWELLDQYKFPSQLDAVNSFG